ncbi:MAG: hypothetical protein GY796_18780 [Chloroflexi bacterium]|nr:hypothetical protein [Chloroflexota bacterium]
MLKRAKRLRQRIVYFYQQLANQPRRWRRYLQNSFAAGLLGLALLLAWGPTPSVHASSITVTPGAAGINVNDGCSLVEAIMNANGNNHSGSGECVAGSGASDTITLAGGTYAYTTAYGTNSALPDITSNITLEANGATVERASGDFRLIQVNSGATLTLNEAIITGGNDYGGVRNQGSLTINDSVISGNKTRDHNGGGIYNEAGIADATVTISNSTIDNNVVWGGGIDPFLGGGIANITTGSGDANLTINNSTISGNLVSGFGGGIANQSTGSGHAQTTINYATITLNRADEFGGFLGLGNGYGGGLYNAANNSTIYLNRTLVSGNTSYYFIFPVVIHEIYDSGGGGIIGNNYNLFGHSLYSNSESFVGFTPSGSDIIATSDGGTPTVFYNILKRGLRDRGSLSHRLTAASPAIDAILCMPGASSDQHGGDRGNGVGAGGSACDIGAVEYDSNAGATITVDAGATGINNGDGCSLVEAIHNANDDRGTYAECTAGAADDTITLAGNSYGYSTAFNSSPQYAALPNIVSDLTIEGNGATIAKTGGPSFGMLLVLENGDLTLNETTVTGGENHGIFSFNGGINLNSSAVTDNSSNYNGGGIYIRGDLVVGTEWIVPEWGSVGELNLNNTTISGNNISGLNGSGGGGIWARETHMHLNNVTLDNNRTDHFSSGGGAIALAGVLGEINNSTISGNSSGGILGEGAIMTYGISAYDWWPYNLMTLNHVTVTGNTAVEEGGGLSIAAGNFQINNSILSGNITTGKPTGNELFITAIKTSASSSCDGCWTDPQVDIYHSVLGHNQLTNAEAIDEMFQYSGSSNFTITNPFWATSNGGSPYALNSIIDTNLETNGSLPVHTPIVGSPAIGHGDVTICAGSSVNSLDQRGAARPYGSDCDAGAVELQEAVQSCSLSASNNLFSFSGGDDVTIAINTMGDLDCLQVEQVPLLHPKATVPFTENRWWHISARNSSGGLASGFNADLTLPDNESIPKICKYPDVVGGVQWDCTGTQVDNGASVTRQGIISFSDWAVGNDPGPTSITLDSIRVQSSASGLWASITLAIGLLGATIRRFWRRV